MQSGKSFNVSELIMYLKGINFPVNKQKIVQMAKTNGAPENVINWINRLPEKQYTAPTEIEQEFSKLK